MPSETPQAAFWNRVARRYAAMPMRNPETWEETLSRTRARLSPDASVLELGCGTGSTAIRLAPHVKRYVGTDDAAEMITIANERLSETPCPTLEFRQGRPGDLSLPEGPFDAILAYNLLHLLPDASAAFSEIHDRLRPGGLFISKTPCFGGIYSVLWPLVRVLRHYGKAPPVRFIRAGKLERLITQAGFRIEERGDHPKRPPSRFLVATRI